MATMSLNKSGMPEETATRPQRLREWISAATPPVAFLVCLIGVWYYGSAKGFVPFYIIPGPQQIAAEFVANNAVLVKHASRTTVEALSGFAIGNVAAIIMSVLLTWSRPLRETIYPYALLSRAIPLIVFTPVIVVMLGRGSRRLSSRWLSPSISRPFST